MIELLTELNKFNDIVFNEENHTYKHGGVDCISVTSVIGLYKEEFDTQKIATAYAVKRGLSVFDVIEEWDTKKEQSIVKGSHFHKYMELKYACKEYEEATRIRLLGDEDNDIYAISKTFDIGDKFYNDTKEKLIPIRSEMVVGDKDRRICGMIDQLFYNVKANEIQIWDYKTNKEIKKQNDYKKKMINGLWHLDECEFNTYSLQLALYKKIIEKNTNLKLGNSYICWVNEKNDTYIPYQMDDMSNEVEHIWSNLKAA